MSIDFFNTGMGRKFYERDVPRIAEALERIASALDRIIKPNQKALNLYTVVTVQWGIIAIEAHSIAEAQADARDRFGVKDPSAVRPCHDARQPTGFAGFHGVPQKGDD